MCERLAYTRLPTEYLIIRSKTVRPYIRSFHQGTVHCGSVAREFKLGILLMIPLRLKLRPQNRMIGMTAERDSISDEVFQMPRIWSHDFKSKVDRSH